MPEPDPAPSSAPGAAALPPLLASILIAIDQDDDHQLASLLRDNADSVSRTRLLVELAQVTKSPVERQHLLEESIRLNGNLVAAAAARLMMRDGFAGRAD